MRIPSWIDTRNLNLCDATGPQQNSATSLTAADPNQDFVTLSSSAGLRVSYYGAGHDVVCHPVDKEEAAQLFKALLRAQPQIPEPEKQLQEVTAQFLRWLTAGA